MLGTSAFQFESERGWTEFSFSNQKQDASEERIAENASSFWDGSAYGGYGKGILGMAQPPSVNHSPFVAQLVSLINKKQKGHHGTPELFHSKWLVEGDEESLAQPELAEEPELVEEPKLEYPSLMSWLASESLCSHSCPSHVSTLSTIKWL